MRTADVKVIKNDVENTVDDSDYTTVTVTEIRNEGEDNEEVVEVETAITASWRDTPNWDIGDVYEIEVTDMNDSEITSTTPKLSYPYYPSMIPESLYHLGNNPEQQIERKIRQMIQQEIDVDDE